MSRRTSHLVSGINIQSALIRRPRHGSILKCGFSAKRRSISRGKGEGKSGVPSSISRSRFNRSTCLLLVEKRSTVRLSSGRCFPSVDRLCAHWPGRAFSKDWCPESVAFCDCMAGGAHSWWSGDPKFNILRKTRIFFRKKRYSLLHYFLYENHRFQKHR